MIIMELVYGWMKKKSPCTVALGLILLASIISIIGASFRIVFCGIIIIVVVIFFIYCLYQLKYFFVFIRSRLNRMFIGSEEEEAENNDESDT